ncbi:MAG: hypothetical protein HN945_10840 [Deltaproteobacteria bacterium]|nr:hypothetical protein [Deltaproteobacteria bacterium]
MLTVGVGQAEGTNSDRVIQQVIEQAQGTLGSFVPQAGIFYASVEFDHQLMLKEIFRCFPDLSLIGCTTAGEFSSSCGFSEVSASLILFYSDTIEIKAGLGEAVSKDPVKAVKNAVHSARKNLSRDESLCLFFPDGAVTASTEVLDCLNQTLDPNCTAFGGCAARHGFYSAPPRLFYHERVLQDAFPLLLFSGDLKYAFSVSNSWTPVGDKKRVMSAHQKDVDRIGSESALDFYMHYLGTHSKPIPEFPLAVYEEGKDQFYIRVPVGYEQGSGKVTFGAFVPNGSDVQLMEATPSKILSETDLSIQSALKGFPDKDLSVALIFSCNARKSILGTKTQNELGFLIDHLPPNTPIAGFYGFAEFSPLIGSTECRLHNTTMVTLLLGASDAQNQISQRLNAAPQKPLTVPEVFTKDSLDQENLLLKKKISSSEYYRRNLENIQEANAALLKTINAEIQAAHQEIQLKNKHLEQLNRELEQEKQKSDKLLRNILPDQIADELKSKGSVEPVYYPFASVLFTDIKGFTTIASQLTPKQLIKELDFYFSAFDRIIGHYGLEKLKTIGDAYMCAGGLPVPRENHVVNMVRAAWDICDFMEKTKQERLTKGKQNWDIRMGIHAGPLMAGVIGKKKFAFDIWGDTVNIASRLETAGAPDKINISKNVYEVVKGDFDCEYRGRIAIKNHGEIDMYFVVGKS